MKIIKKLIKAAAVSFVCLTLYACGGGSGGNSPTPPPSTQTGSVTVTDPGNAN